MEKATTTSTINNSEVNNFTNKFEQIEDLWNIENTKKWNQTNAKVLEIILEELGPDDSILVDKYETAIAI